MFDGEEAMALGLIDRVVPAADFLPLALEEARVMASGDRFAFAGMKRLLREPIAEAMRSREGDSIREFVRIWYSETTRRQLKGVEIRKE